MLHLAKLALTTREYRENASALAEKEEAPAADSELVAKIEAMIEARRVAKKEKNFAEADRIRAELTEMGVTLIDTREGTSYKIEG